MTLIAIFLYSGLAETDRLFRTVGRRAANRRAAAAAGDPTQQANRAGD